MKKLAILFALLGVVAGAAGAVQNLGSVGTGQTNIIPGSDSNPCNGTLCINFDGSAENGFCWQYGGCVPPYYGAFAECCDSGSGYAVCGIEIIITSIGNPSAPCDLYVWNDGGGMPGGVNTVTTGVNVGSVPIYPNFLTFDSAINVANVTGVYWFGYWANFANQGCGYFIAMDSNGFGGCPMTNVAPGIGYPTGWQNPGPIYGYNTQSLGIGAWYGGTPPNPVQESTWGQIKNLYN